MGGFVYLMTNPSMPNLVKIGVSDKDPEEHRVRELSNTSVPEPFKVEYYAFTRDPYSLRRMLINILNKPSFKITRIFFYWRVRGY